MKKAFGSPSALVLAFLISLLLVLRFSYPQWNGKTEDSVITWDVAGYYSYLPAIFIYDDLANMQFMDSMNAKYHMASTLYMLHKSPINLTYIMYPVGVALIEAPWFFTGHVVAKIGNYPQDGFSAPYQAALAFGMLVYACLGLIVLRKLLLKFFDEFATSLTLLIILLGTNLLFFASWFNTLAHTPNFLFIALAMYLSLDWLKKPSFKRSIILGAVLAICTLIRPSDVLIVLFPILYGVTSRSSVLQRLDWFVIKGKYIVVLCLAGLLIVSIQLRYWHFISGKWLFFSYPGEWFDFSQPHIMQVLFSYEKGWLLYSPLLVIPLFVIICQLFKPQAYTYAVGVIMILATYIIASWSNWWYGGGGFGHRAFLEYYPLLALPLASGIDWMRKKNSTIRILLLSLIGLLVLFSLFQQWQWHKRIICRTNNTKQAYWQAFLLTDIEKVNESLRSDNFSSEDMAGLNPDDFIQKKLATIDMLTFQDSLTVPLEINKDRLFSQSFTGTFKEAGIPLSGAWLVVRTKFKIHDPKDLEQISLITTCLDKKEKTTYHYSQDTIRWNSTKLDSDIEVITRVALPKARFKSDCLKIYLYNRNSSDIHVGVYNMEITIMESRKSRITN